ncbi:MAG: hypothetical protein QXG39_09755 [Candidatus Aenigmatarchaeota archaeon]
MRFSSIIFLILTLISSLSPWYYWNVFYYRYAFTSVDFQFFLTFYLWGVSGEFPREAYNVNLGSNPVNIVSSILNGILGLFIISMIFIVLGIILNMLQGKIYAYAQTSCFALATLLCFIGVTTFFILMAGKNGQLYGKYHDEVRGPLVYMEVDSEWGPSIGPYLAIFAIIFGLYESIKSWKEGGTYRQIGIQYPTMSSQLNLKLFMCMMFKNLLNKVSQA